MAAAQVGEGWRRGFPCFTLWIVALGWVSRSGRLDLGKCSSAAANVAARFGMAEGGARSQPLTRSSDERGREGVSYGTQLAFPLLPAPGHPGVFPTPPSAFVSLSIVLGRS